MTEPRTYDLYAIVSRFVGPLEPLGETRADELRLGNVQEFSSLVTRMVRELIDLSRHRYRVEYSMKTIGKVAHACIEEIREETSDDSELCTLQEQLETAQAKVVELERMVQELNERLSRAIA